MFHQKADWDKDDTPLTDYLRPTPVAPEDEDLDALCGTDSAGLPKSLADELFEAGNSLA